MPPPILASDALRKCGNPSCAKPGNVKDATLARCSACRVIAYCSGECQRGHWKLHKTVCMLGDTTATCHIVNAVCILLVVRVLILFKANRDAKDNAGNTPMSIAKQKN